MKIIATLATAWKRALKAARRTVGRKPLDKEPSPEWRKQMLLAEHSPIRLVEYDIDVDGIKQWVSAHLCRHWLGFIPFVHSQRPDRRVLDCDRDDLPQGSLNDAQFSANAQALINISRKRLCSNAATDTRKTWVNIKTAIEAVDPIMAGTMVPECIYRGFCPELKCCGFVHTEKYKRDLEAYRSGCDSLTNKNL